MSIQSKCINFARLNSDESSSSIVAVKQFVSSWSVHTDRGFWHWIALLQGFPKHRCSGDNRKSPKTQKMGNHPNVPMVSSLGLPWIWISMDISMNMWYQYLISDIINSTLWRHCCVTQVVCIKDADTLLWLRMLSLSSSYYSNYLIQAISRQLLNAN